MTEHSFPKHIIVTGAGRGIGKAMALGLAAEDCNILCVSRTDNCSKTRDQIIANGGNASSLIIDFNNEELVRKSISKWLAEQNASHIGIIAAAAQLGPQGPLTKNAMTEWESTFRVNLFGNLAVVQSALSIMEKHNYGRIIMLAGGGAAYAYPIFPAYACSKTALVREVENLAADLDSKGDIVVVCLAPGAIDTDMLKAIRAAGAQVKTEGNITDVIDCVKSLLSKQCKPLSGRFIHVRDNWDEIIDGGGESLPSNHWKLRRIE